MAKRLPSDSQFIKNTRISSHSKEIQELTTANPKDTSTSTLLTVILPTYNEAGTIGLLIPNIFQELLGFPIEVIVVDDNSPDGTAGIIKGLMRDESHLTLLERKNKMGLSGAVLEGVKRAKGNYICVMDSDLSHQPKDLLKMINAAAYGYDLIIGSRYSPGATIVGVSPIRRLISRVVNKTARLIFGLSMSDVMTGYLLCRRNVLVELPTNFSSKGFKLLLEILVTNPKLNLAEIPIHFQDRFKGQSKANFSELIQLFALCIRLAKWKLKNRTGSLISD